MNNRSLLSLLGVFGVLAVAACSASNGAGSGTNNGNGATGAGAGSGVGAGNAPGSGAGSSNTNINAQDDAGPDGGDVANGVCANQSFDLQRKPAEILIVLDRSESMIRDTDDKDIPSGSGIISKWTIVQQGVSDVVKQTDASVSWGLKVFPEGEGKACVAGSVTNAILVDIAPTNAGPVTGGVSNTTPAGNGTPTGDAVRAGITYLKTLTDPNPKFILLATDGKPSCSGTTEDSGAALTDAIAAITSAASANFKTIVVGIGTKNASDALNQMAVAGQMPSADPNPLAPKYYLATTVAELVDSLKLITGQVSSCVFDLTATPPDPYNIAVHVNDMKAPPDMTKQNGWDYTGADMKQIQVYGSWCDQIKAANANTVNFVFGCVGQPPPA